jgi:hypothetical protein
VGCRAMRNGNLTDDESIGFELYKAVTMKIVFFWTVVRKQPNLSEKRIASIFKVEE